MFHASMANLVASLSLYKHHIHVRYYPVLGLWDITGPLELFQVHVTGWATGPLAISLINLWTLQYSFTYSLYSSCYNKEFHIYIPYLLSLFANPHPSPSPTITQFSSRHIEAFGPSSCLSIFLGVGEGFMFDVCVCPQEIIGLAFFSSEALLKTTEQAQSRRNKKQRSKECQTPMKRKAAVARQLVLQGKNIFNFKFIPENIIL